MKKIVLLGIGVMLMFMLMPFQQATAQTVVPVKNPGTWTSDYSAIDFSPLDPATDYESMGGELHQVVSEGLMTYDGNSISDFAPSLATSWTLAPNGTQWTFMIRSGVTFSNGDPFNAYVMQFSIQRAIIMNDPSGGIWIADQFIKGAPAVYKTDDMNVTEANTFLGLQSVRAVNDTALVIDLEAQASAFLSTMLYISTNAVSAKVIAENAPVDYTTNQSDDSFGMVSLTDVFPTLDNATIRAKLGLAAGWDVAKSGVVPQAIHNGAAKYAYLADKIIGTGPYILDKVTPGVEIDLKKNTNWWNKAAFNANSPDNVAIKAVAEDTTRILDLKNGNAIAASIVQVDQVINTTTLEPYFDNIFTYTRPSINEYFLGFNFNDTFDSSLGLMTQSNADDGYNASYISSHNLLKYSWKDNSTGTPMVQYASPDNPFTSLLFRKAMAYAFDYDAYINDVYHGLAFRMQGVIPKGLAGHQDDLISQGYIPSLDTAVAKSLFQQVNWKGDIYISYNSGSETRRLSALLLKNTIAQMGVGINILLQELSWPTYLDYNYGGKLPIFWLGWGPDYADATDYTYPFLYTGGLFPVSQGNYSNPRVDALIDAAAVETDPVVQDALYRQMEINASGDYGMIYGHQPESVAIRSKWVTGWDQPLAGSLNAINNAPNYQYLGLEPYTLGGTGGTTTTTGGTGGTTTTTTGAGSTTTTEQPAGSPGFEMVSVIAGLFISVAALSIYRKRKN